jgi:hypothetical protein
MRCGFWRRGPAYGTVTPRLSRSPGGGHGPGVFPTNTALHLPAVAHEAGLHGSSRFDQRSQPADAAPDSKLIPSGNHFVQDLGNAGGLPAGNGRTE